MTINYKDQQYNLPSFLRSITIEQWIRWKETFGNELEARQLEIDIMPESSEKDVEAFLLLSDMAVKFFAFYTGVPLEEVRETVDVNQLINIYTSTQQLMKEEEVSIVPEAEYFFENSFWQIVPPISDSGDKGMSFDDFQTVKAVLLNLKDLSEGNWRRLPLLCAMYLRKEGELIESQMKNIHDRKVTMMHLPLHIGISVGKYLTETLQVFSQITGTGDAVHTETR